MSARDEWVRRYQAVAHHEDAWLDAAQTMWQERLRNLSGAEAVGSTCLHCGRARLHHSGPEKKCLFETTHYEPYGVAAALVLRAEMNREPR